MRCAVHQNVLSLKEALAKLKSEYGCKRITIQSEGTLNDLFLHDQLLDYIVVAPVLIGGKDTATQAVFASAARPNSS